MRSYKWYFKFLFFFCMLFLLPSKIFSLTEINSETLKKIAPTIELVKITNLNSKKMFVLKDTMKNKFFIEKNLYITEKILKTILKLKEQFFSWTNLTIQQITFEPLSDKIQIYILPAEFIYDGIEINKYIPMGMFFIYKGTLSYNFRLVKDNFFIKIEGFFISEEQLCKKLLGAIKNPAGYLKKYSPDYFVAQLDKLSEEIDFLKEQNKILRYAIVTLITKEKVKHDIIDKVVELKMKNPKITIDEIQNKLKSINIHLSKKVINTILTVYFNEWKKLGWF